MKQLEACHSSAVRSPISTRFIFKPSPGGRCAPCPVNGVERSPVGKCPIPLRNRTETFGLVLNVLSVGERGWKLSRPLWTGSGHRNGSRTWGTRSSHSLHPTVARSREARYDRDLHRSVDQAASGSSCPLPFFGSGRGSGTTGCSGGAGRSRRKRAFRAARLRRLSSQQIQGHNRVIPIIPLSCETGKSVVCFGL